MFSEYQRMSFNWKPLPAVCRQAGEIHHLPKPQLYFGPKQAPLLQPGVSEAPSTGYLSDENCNIIHFTVTMRTNPPRLNSKIKLWTVNHIKRELTCSAEQGFLVCVTLVEGAGFICPPPGASCSLLEKRPATVVTEMSTWSSSYRVWSSRCLKDHALLHEGCKMPCRGKEKGGMIHSWAGMLLSKMPRAGNTARKPRIF